MPFIRQKSYRKCDNGPLFAIIPKNKIPHIKSCGQVITYIESLKINFKLPFYCHVRA